MRTRSTASATLSVSPNPTIIRTHIGFFRKASGTNGASGVVALAIWVPMLIGSVGIKSRMKRSASRPWSRGQKNSAKGKSGQLRQGVLKPRHNTKVAPPPLSAQRKFRILRLRNLMNLTIGSYQLGAYQIVACQIRDSCKPTEPRQASIRRCRCGRSSHRPPLARAPGWRYRVLPIQSRLGDGAYRFRIDRNRLHER